mmetsp:Transcript_15972/g.49896  ORF Transcript_15972/g.49896 Transcript_15972/m.49896 type:complete len:358 (-) Transcript_15972:1067-2140(-)
MSVASLLLMTGWLAASVQGACYNDRTSDPCVLKNDEQNPLISLTFLKHAFILGDPVPQGFVLTTTSPKPGSLQRAGVQVVPESFSAVTSGDCPTWNRDCEVLSQQWDDWLGVQDSAPLWRENVSLALTQVLRPSGVPCDTSGSSDCLRFAWTSTLATDELAETDVTGVPDGLHDSTNYARASLTVGPLPGAGAYQLRIVAQFVDLQRITWTPTLAAVETTSEGTVWQEEAAGATALSVLGLAYFLWSPLVQCDGVSANLTAASIVASDSAALDRSFILRFTAPTAASTCTLSWVAGFGEESVEEAAGPGQFAPEVNAGTTGEAFAIVAGVAFAAIVLVIACCHCACHVVHKRRVGRH